MRKPRLVRGFFYFILHSMNSYGVKLLATPEEELCVSREIIRSSSLVYVNSIDYFDYWAERLLKWPLSRDASCVRKRRL